MNRKFPQFLRSQDVAIAGFLVATAFVVRIVGLSLDSLWFDEVFSVRAAQLGLGQIVSLTSGDVHPPLYYLLLHFWLKVFGTTETAVRMLSVCFSSLTVPLVYQLGIKLFNRRTAFFAALLTTLAPFQVFYAQETRMYAQLAFFSAASIYWFVVWSKDDRRLNGVLYVVSTTLLLYTHIYAAFVVLAQVLYLVVIFFTQRAYFQKHLRRSLTGLLVTCLLFLPWAVVIFRQAEKAGQGFWIKETGWLAPLQTLIEYCGSLWLAFLLLPLFLLGIKACGALKTEDKNNCLPYQRAFLLLLLAVPILVPFSISKFGTPFYLAKYTIAASLPFYMFAAIGLAHLRSVAAQVVIVAVICLCAGLVLKNDLTSLKRERWRDAAYNIEQSAQPGDLVLFNSTGSYLSFKYYSKRSDLAAAVFPYAASDKTVPSEVELLKRTGAEGFSSANPPTEQETKDMLQKIVGARSRVWLITRYGDGFKNDFEKSGGAGFRVSAQPPLCFNQRRFLFSETYSEANNALILEQRGLSCAAQVYLFERQ